MFDITFLANSMATTALKVIAANIKMLIFSWWHVGQLNFSSS
jgi:hypothetical protein